MRARGLSLTASLALLLAVPVGAGGAPASSQRFFTRMLLRDTGTSAAVKRLLRSGGGFVEPRVLFADLTGDRRADAVVLVGSGGAAGDVALYVFSTQGRNRTEGPLRAVFHSQSLYRASALLRNGRLVYRSPRYAAGDDLCCPSTVLEHQLRWSARTGRFTVGRARRVS